MAEIEYFSDESFSAFLTEEESMINSHPSRAATHDINDLKPITSNHLLIGKSSPISHALSKNKALVLERHRNHFKKLLKCSGKGGLVSANIKWKKEVRGAN